MKRDEERAKQKFAAKYNGIKVPVSMDPNNIKKTYHEFIEKWLPFHARKERLSPNSYVSYHSILDTHILPYFGDKVMSSITAEDTDNFMDYLSKKPCKGSKCYGKKHKVRYLLLALLQ